MIHRRPQRIIRWELFNITIGTYQSITRSLYKLETKKYIREIGHRLLYDHYS